MALQTVQQLMESKEPTKIIRNILGQAIFSGEVEHYLRYVLTIHQAYLNCIQLTETHLDYILKMKCRSSNRVQKYLLQNLLLPYTKYTYHLWSSEHIVQSLFVHQQLKLDQLTILVGYKTISEAISIVNSIGKMGEAVKQICPVVAEIQKALSEDIQKVYMMLIDSLEESATEQMKQLMGDLQNMIFAVTLESKLLEPCLETTLTRSSKYLEETKLEEDT